MLYYLQHFVQWLLNPATMLDGAMKLMSMDIKIFNYLLPTMYAGRLNDAANYFSSDVFHKAIGLGVYLMSPFVDPSLLLACMGVYLYVWLIGYVVTLCFMVKGWITGQGS
jgi:hypothetical protein